MVTRWLVSFFFLGKPDLTSGGGGGGGGDHLQEEQQQQKVKAHDKRQKWKWSPDRQSFFLFVQKLFTLATAAAAAAD